MIVAKVCGCGRQKYDEDTYEYKHTRNALEMFVGGAMAFFTNQHSQKDASEIQRAGRH